MEEEEGKEVAAGEEKEEGRPAWRTRPGTSNGGRTRSNTNILFVHYPYD